MLSPTTDQVRGWIDAANCGLTGNEVLARTEQGHFRIFVHPDGCMVGEFIVSPRAIGFNIFAAGGSLTAMNDLIPEAESFARARGATFAGCVGRKGWVRFLKSYGYAPEVSVQKEL